MTAPRPYLNPCWIRTIMISVLMASIPSGSAAFSHPRRACHDHLVHHCRCSNYVPSLPRSTRRLQTELCASVVNDSMTTSKDPNDNNNNYTIEEDPEPITACQQGYYLDSVSQMCRRLGPLGIASQWVERSPLFRKASERISRMFGINRAKMERLGVAFALSYSVLSNINGSISLSVSWYIACMRTGLSPLAPGNWTELIKAYATIYAIIQLLRPFRVAAAIAMSQLSSEILEVTQSKLSCSRKSAIAIQFGMSIAAWLGLSLIGVSLASWKSGVPLLEGVAAVAGQ